MLLPEEDQLTLSKENVEGMIAYAMGGRAAEEVVFGQMTTGAGNDIEKATAIARKMVCNWGMSERVGPLAVGGHGQEVFLGREMTTHEATSNKILEAIDDEVRRFVTEGYQRARTILENNRPILDNMSEALLIRETLGAKEIEQLMRGEVIISEEERQQYEMRRKGQSPDGGSETTTGPKKWENSAVDPTNSTPSNELQPMALGT
jgi:cell division protease FtsH